MLKKYLLAVGVMVCGWNFGMAQDALTPEQMAREIAPLVSENTVCVAHVDLTKLEPKQIGESFFALKKKCLEIMPEDVRQGRFGVPLSSFFWINNEQDVKYFTDEATAALEQMTKTQGVRDAYIVVMLGGEPFYICLAFPVRDGTNTENVIIPFARKDQLCLLPLMPLEMGIGEPGNAKRQEYIDLMFGKGFAAVERPEIARGLALVKDAPVKAVTLWPSYMKMLMTQVIPQWPEPFEAVSSDTLLDGVRFVAAGFNPNNLHGELIISSKDQSAAERLHDLVTTFADKYEDRLLKFPQVGMPAYVLLNVMAQNSNVLFPAPRDGNITIHFKGVDSVDDIRKIVNDLDSSFRKTPAHGQVTRMQCVNNLKQITLAMHNYHDANGCLPPAYTVDKDGKPLYSWRVLLLPYLEQYALYKSIKLDEPWDSTHNKQFHDKCTEIYQCPSMTDEEKRSGMTSYSIVLGKDTYPIPGKRNFSMAGITDGTSNTIAVIERKTPVNWMCPTEEITQEQAFRGWNDPESGIGLRHDEGTGLNVSLFDGSVYFLKNDFDLIKWRAMLTRNGGEIVSW